MNALYNLAIRLYDIGIKAAAMRNPKAARIRDGRRLTFPTLASALQPGRRYVWIHAASLGEFEQGRPLMERLRRESPHTGIVLTFFSPSGYEVRKNYRGADIVCYLPADTPRLARRFVETVRPTAAVFVKYEFWGNLLGELQRMEVPTYLISAIFRPRQIFFKPWGGQFRRMLRCFTHIFVQDEASRRLLSGIGCSDATVAGDTRFDRVTDILNTTVDMPCVERFVEDSSFTLIAGSSWPADEDHYISWFNEAPSTTRLIIAPHEFDAARLEALRSRVAGGAVMLSELEAGRDPGEARCLIVDCFGKLASLYRYGSAALIGGGFGAGIHNINEAAVYGMPVIFGPRHDKFKEAADLLACGGGFCYTDRTTLDDILQSLSTDSAFLQKSGKAAGDYVRSQLGATSRIWDQAIAPLLGLKKPSDAPKAPQRT